MKRIACLLLLGLTVGNAAGGTLSQDDQAYYRSLAPDGALFGWCQQVTQTPEGWEYWIDFYTSGGQNDGWGYWIGGFDVSGVQNYADMPYVRDIWSYENFGRGTDFVMPDSVHVFEDYGTDGMSAYRTATYDGTVMGGPPGGAVETDRMWMLNWRGATGGMDPGLLMTWRFVLDQPVYQGEMWVSTSMWAEGLPVFNMPIEIVPDPGDFDDDGDVDVDDINALCANMTGDGIPLPPGFEQYDLDGDGDADSEDMNILIHDLVETTVGVGTEYGDFNLDGKIDTVDLTILGTYFGVGTSWSQGNANCDTTVDTVDLTILGTYFGFVASSPIPEPATLALLGCGACLPLFRREKR